MKIVTIVGARPQFVKAAVISREIFKRNDVSEIIVHTGQHFDHNMTDVFFEEMEIPKPGYNLNIHSLSHGAMTGRMLEKIEEVLITEKPDWLLVYGDTNSTIAGALAAKKLHIKVAHIEAGLRSFNMRMPEEVNRILTDRISDILFCPTDTAVENLKKEGVSDSVVRKSGDVMYDAALYYSEKIKGRSSIADRFDQDGFILCTLHRAENTDDLRRLNDIVIALNRINKETSVLIPLHPRTQQILKKNNIILDCEVIDPVGYFDMIALIQKSKLVMTDSGGLQKEAFFFQKYCITMRDETEWVELVSNGFNILVGANTGRINEAYNTLKNMHTDFNKALYGDGQSAKMIVDDLIGIS
ncbi:non-hydrolyzing UDP-N-acetylglucosamine 2-epimerase [Chitinophaga sp. RAB17]|uniref:non-hydrolyzing UDP-N-acetylglucosamine 2-epimerase n=1 Tax=Chitinophaga sp. RAB17 TaxID=3233049 RepID=UPI003F8F3BC1